MKKILIVNPFGIGDVLFATPLIAALKERYPGVSISFLGSARTVPFLKNDPRIDKVFCYERNEFVAVYRKSPWQFGLKWLRLVQDIRREKFDVAFDLSMGSPLGLALVVAGVPERIGFNHKGRGRWLTRSIPLKGFEGRHVVEYNLDLLRLLDYELRAKSIEHRAVDAEASETRAVGSGNPGMTASTSLGSKLYAPSSYRMSFFTSTEDEAWADDFLKQRDLKPSQVIGLYPGGGASWGAEALVRRWAWENYVKLADKIVETSSAAIILMGDKADVPLCEMVAGAMSRRPQIATGLTTLGQSAALMKRCRCVVLNDGGAMHVAAASGVRTAVVFGPVAPEVYGPYPVRDHKIATSRIACRPCYRNFRMSDCRHQSCLKQLTVDDVYQQIEGLL